MWKYHSKALILTILSFISRFIPRLGKDWIPKLKVNLRAEAAHIPVIVSMVLPDEAISGFGNKDGVWICKPSLVPGTPKFEHSLYKLSA